MKSLVIMMASVITNFLIVFYSVPLTRFLLEWMQNWNHYAIYSFSWLVLLFVIVFPINFLMIFQEGLVRNDLERVKQLYTASTIFSIIVLVSICVNHVPNFPLLINLLSLACASEIGRAGFNKKLHNDTMFDVFKHFKNSEK